MNWLEEIEKYKEDFIRDLRGIIAIPSVRDEATISDKAPFGKGCKEALDYMLELGRQEGFSVRNVDGYAGVITYGEGEESVGVLAHLDVVPVGEGWSKDPFKGEIVDGYMFGRGCIDDKGPGMAGFYALKMLRDRNIKLNKKIMLIYGCDEESGMACMDHYVKSGQEIPDMGFTPDAEFPVIYGEKGGLHIALEGSCESVISSMHAGERANIVIGTAKADIMEWNDRYTDLFDFYLKANDLKGGISFDGRKATIFIEGVLAHAAEPWNGVNAALHILNFVGSAFGDKFAHDTYEMLKDWQGKPLGIDINGAYMGFLTMNTGIVNIQDGKADILIDIRYPNDADPQKILEGFQKKKQELNYVLDVVLKHNTKPLFVDPNSELVNTLSEVYRTYSKDDFTPNITIGGGTYAKKFPNFVAFGPEFPNREKTASMFVGGCHQCDEGVKVDDLLLSAAIYTAALEKLAK